MNRLLCQSSPPGKVEQQLTPRQIWDFIECIGVREQTSIEDVVRCIGDMEQRDWDTFREIASKEKQKAVDKELFGCSHSLRQQLLVVVLRFVGDPCSFWNFGSFPVGFSGFWFSAGDVEVHRCWGLMGLFVYTASSVFAAVVEDPLIVVGLPSFAAAAVVGGFVFCW
ncbi:hypothetical protein Ancab_033686 [Ancistrocladus abbreviatus]